jgi:hypothetical protein
VEHVGDRRRDRQRRRIRGAVMMQEFYALIQAMMINKMKTGPSNRDDK